MSNPVVFNILKSNAVIYNAPVGEPLPDPESVQAGEAWGGNWTRVGFTQEPVTFQYEDERTDIVVEEVLAKIDQVRTSESAQLETTLAELTAEYMALGLGGTPATDEGVEELEVGNQVLLPKRAWGLEGIRYDEDGVGQPLRIFFYTATAQMNGELQFSKHEDQYTGIPLHVEALADVENGGRLFLFQRVAAEAESA